jgi:hypothetical protein
MVRGEASSGTQTVRLEGVVKGPFLLCGFFLVLFLFVAGCANNYEKFFARSAPNTYPATSDVLVFKYDRSGLREAYEGLFYDWVVIGKSSFIGPLESESNLKAFGCSVGADIVLVSSSFSETRDVSVPIITPTYSSTSYSGTVSGKSFSGTASSHGTQTDFIPISVNRYSQRAIFLKNISDKKPLWQLTEDDFKREGVSEFDGTWSNAEETITVFTSANNVLGFNKDTKKITFSFSKKESAGVFFKSDRTPLYSEFSINNFGFLVADLGKGASVSYTKK